MAATLRQAKKVLELFEDVPSGQLQALLASGLLADLRDGNIAEVERDDFRRTLGLKPLRPTVTITIDPAKPYGYDMRLKGLRFESDIEYRAGAVMLELVEFLKAGETWISGAEMATRAKEIGANLGQKHAEALLENQHLIPGEWRHFYLAFPGTVWRDSCGLPRFPYLTRRGQSWVLETFWLGDVWHLSVRLLRPRMNKARLDIG
jgi:hypothetical protein